MTLSVGLTTPEGKNNYLYPHKQKQETKKWSNEKESPNEEGISSNARMPSHS